MWCCWWSKYYFKNSLNPGDEVIAFALYFGEYKNYTENYDGKLIEVPTNIETFEPDLDALKMLLLQNKSFNNKHSK